MFFSAADYALYRDLLAASCRTAKVECRAWVAMPNHGHLILVPRDADSLRAALAPAHRAYAGLIHARRKPKDDRQAHRHRIATGLPFSSITTLRSLSAFPITLTELKAMAAAAIMGDKRMPKTG